ncbi:hypothetical protein K437DRAFT_270860 [Tilletiaria anomala UBC 951]|uniref:Uncharacterized protein n=1 Tax=Tilletiaria anomala (strain ATCC 24038 / CBS 436.72 / UBC 951) TaxID=1037660 RepID=A0A066VFC5_TILAU|nr:uncharacterized protein K437DRAFT_270860 [Tilletiaria anomala UBC 951]KDN37459.1 hypothetical protein K437DRAFT_270860 [Tilletiaria anomala UBC 951]
MSKSIVPTPTRSTFGRQGISSAAGSTTPISLSFGKHVNSPRVGPIAHRSQYYAHHDRRLGGAASPEACKAPSASVQGEGAPSVATDSDEEPDPPFMFANKKTHPSKALGLKKYGRVNGFAGTGSQTFSPSKTSYNAAGGILDTPISASSFTAPSRSHAQQLSALAGQDGHCMQQDSGRPSYVPSYLQERKASVRKARYEEEAKEMEMAENDGVNSISDTTTDADGMNLDSDFEPQDHDGEETEDENKGEEEERAVPSKWKPRRTPNSAIVVDSDDSSDLTDLELDMPRTTLPRVRQSQGQVKKLRREAAAARKAQKSHQASHAGADNMRAKVNTTAQSISAALIGHAEEHSPVVRGRSASSQSEPQAQWKQQQHRSLLLEEQETFDSSSEPTFTDFFADSTDEDDDEAKATGTEDAVGAKENVVKLELDDEAIQAFLRDALLPADSSSGEEEDEEEELTEEIVGGEGVMSSAAMIHGSGGAPQLQAQDRVLPQLSVAPTTHLDSVPILVIEETDGRLIRARATGGDAVFGSDGEFEYVGGEDTESDSDDYGHSDAVAEDEGMDSDEDAYMDGAGNPLFMDADEAAKAGLLDDSDDDGDDDDDKVQQSDFAASRRGAQSSRHVGKNRMHAQSTRHSRHYPTPHIITDSSSVAASSDGETTDDLGEYDMPFPRLLVGSVAPKGGRAAKRARRMARESRKRNKKALRAARQIAIVNQANAGSAFGAGGTGVGLDVSLVQGFMLPPMFVIGGLPATSDLINPAAAAAGDAAPWATPLSPSTAGLSTPILQSDLPLPNVISAASSSMTPPPLAPASTSASEATGDQQEQQPIARTPSAPATAAITVAACVGPRMGTFTASAKSRRRALIDGSAGVPSPFAMSTAPRSRGARRSESSPNALRSMIKAESRHQRQDLLSPLARRTKAKNKGKKVAQDLRRRSYRIKEIDLHDLVHQDAWRDNLSIEQRQLSPYLRPKLPTQVIVTGSKTPRFVAEYGFKRGANQFPASPATAATPYKNHQNHHHHHAALPHRSARHRSSSRSTHRRQSRTELSPSLPLLHISEVDDRSNANHIGQRASTSGSTGGHTIGATSTPVMRTTGSGGNARLRNEGHASHEANMQQPYALCPPSSECDNALMQFSPLFGGIVPALNMNSDDLDSFTL